MTARTTGRWLRVLTGLFAIRVVAQPAALRVEWLPSFDCWHGGVLPYPILLAVQCGIFVWLATTARKMTSARLEPHRRLGLGWLVVGGIYFAAMSLRLFLGLTVFAGHPWFDRRLPAFFHLVLASYLLLYGYFHFHSRSSDASSRRKAQEGIS